MSDIKSYLQRITSAENDMQRFLESKYPVGSIITIAWMHESKPKVEVIQVRKDAIRFQLVEPVMHRILSKGVFQDVGFEAWINVDGVIDD